MIATSTMVQAPRIGARTRADFARVAESFREEAKAEAQRLLGDVSGKRISAAAIPGATRNSISRALNGCDSCPVWRLGGWIVLCRWLGVPKWRVQRVIDGLQALADRVYDDAPAEPLEELLDRDASVDGKDELPRQRAARGDQAGKAELLDVKREALALNRAVVARLSAEVKYAG